MSDKPSVHNRATVKVEKAVIPPEAIPEKPTVKVPPRTSGEHPVVQFARRKLDSIVENEVEDLRALNERLAKATTPAPKDARREPNDDPRLDDSPPTDIVEVAPDPFPSDPPPSTARGRS